MKIAVLGAGAWGSALAINFSTRHTISLWTKDPDHAAEMDCQRVNQRFFPGYHLPRSLTITSNLCEALAAADLVLIVVPIAGFRETLQAIVAIGVRVPVVWGCKGFESETSYLPHQVVEEEAKLWPYCGVLSGPSFAQEVAQGLPTALTLASKNVDFSTKIASELHSSRLRIYTSQDVIGVETAGALKNIIAVGAGALHGLGYGDNAKAAIIARGLTEITRLGVAMGANPLTYSGLSGVGDLIVTGTSVHSRNWRAGDQLGRGEKLEDVERNMGMVIEGISTTKAAYELAQELGVYMPITQAIYSVIYQGASIDEAIKGIMSGEFRQENEWS